MLILDCIGLVESGTNVGAHFNESGATAVKAVDDMSVTIGAAHVELFRVEWTSNYFASFLRVAQIFVRLIARVRNDIVTANAVVAAILTVTRARFAFVGRAKIDVMFTMFARKARLASAFSFCARATI